MTHLRLLLPGLALVCCACPAPTECDPLVDDCTDGGLRPDFCDSRQQADQDAVHCQLALGVPLDGGAYLSTVTDGGVDTDWYLVRMPAGLTGRSLLHVNGGYTAPQTAVHFQINVLVPSADGGGLTSLVTGSDPLQGPPKLVDLVVPFSQSNAAVYLLVGDKVTGATFKVDNRNPYSLLAEVIDNPDLNEPNDTLATATRVPLTTGNGGLQGSATGALATDNDVDRYSFSLTPLVGRQIIYLHLTGPNPQPTPPAFGRLQYTLYDPLNTPLAEGVVDYDYQVIDLATAHLATIPGTYSVEVRGYQPANSTAVVKGDLRLQYTMQVRILPDLDGNEPNDSLGNAVAVDFAAPGSKSFTGKLSYVQDEEWFKVTLPARAGPSTFRYRIAVAAAAGRFAPLSTAPSRQLRLLEPVVTGGTTQDNQVACLTSPAACPKGFTDPNSPDRILVESLCRGSDRDAGTSTPAECLYAERNETARFDNLKNEVGAIPVEANKATTVHVMFRDQGLARAKYADDRDWTLTLDWVDDPDRAGRLAGPTQVTLGGAPTASSGQLTFGYGQLLDGFDLTTGAGIRGPNDYDAFETDKDLWQFNLGGGAAAQSWAVSWDLQHGDGGVPPGELSLEITTCTGVGPSTDGGLCPGAKTFIFGYSARSLSPWYQPNNASTAVPLFSRVNGPGSLTVTALPVGCECFSAVHAAAGRIFVNVAGVNRVSNEPISYTLRQSIAPYPTPATCPVVDAGCGFDKVP